MERKGKTIDYFANEKLSNNWLQTAMDSLVFLNLCSSFSSSVTSLKCD